MAMSFPSMAAKGFHRNFVYDSQRLSRIRQTVFREVREHRNGATRCAVGEIGETAVTGIGIASLRPAQHARLAEEPRRSDRERARDQPRSRTDRPAEADGWWLPGFVFQCEGQARTPAADQ